MANLDVSLRPVATDSNAMLVELSGVIDGSTVARVQASLSDVLQRGVSKAIVDMNRVRYVNSAGLSALVQFADQFKSRGGGVALIRVTAKVRIVIEMLGLQSHFEIAAGEQEALAALGGGAASPPTAGSGSAQFPPPGSGSSFAPPAPVASGGFPPPTGSASGGFPPPTGSASGGFPPPGSGAAFPPPGSGAAFPPPGSGSFPPPGSGSVAPPTPGKPVTACKGCGADLEIPSAGNWKCPRCRTIVTQRPDGSVEFLAPAGSPPFELTIACTREGTEAVMQFAATVGQPSLKGGQKLEILRAAVGEVAYVITSTAYGFDASKVFHVSIETKPEEVVVQFADQGQTLDPSQLQSYFPNATRSTQDFECKSHPKGGNLVRFSVRA